MYFKTIGDIFLFAFISIVFIALTYFNILYLQSREYSKMNAFKYWIRFFAIAAMYNFLIYQIF